MQRCIDRPVKSLHIISDDRGQRLTYMRIWGRHKNACEAAGGRFELRAIRRKTAPDGDSLAHAQDLLGHADTETTRRHYRKGELVRPLKCAGTQIGIALLRSCLVTASMMMALESTGMWA